MRIGTLSFKGITIESDYPVSDVPCGTCVDCCSKLTPYLTQEELTSGQYAYTFMKVDGCDEPVISIPKSVHGGCMYLIDNRCSIYSKRPKACRQFDCRYPETSHQKVSNKFSDTLNFNFHNKTFAIKIHSENELSSNRLKYDEKYIQNKLTPYLDILKEGDVYFDIGSNIGLTAIFAAKIVGDSGLVYAFEPDEKNFNLLMENIKLNNITNIIPVKKAILDENKLSRIMNSTNNFEEHSVDNTIVDDVSPLYYNNGNVECITLDSFLDQVDNVDVIKINAVGSEVKILNGGAKLFNTRKPIVILNYNPSALMVCGSTIFDIFSFIDKNKYIPYRQVTDNIFEPVEILNIMNLTAECIENKKSETLFLRLKTD